MNKKDLASIKAHVEIGNIFLTTAYNHINSTIKVYVKTKKARDVGIRLGLSLAKTNIVSVMEMLDRMVKDYQGKRHLLQKKEEGAVIKEEECQIKSRRHIR